MAYEDAQPLHIYALEQQGRGLRLLNRCEHLPSETVLTSSILLICFEAPPRPFVNDNHAACQLQGLDGLATAISAEGRSRSNLFQGQNAGINLP